VTEATLHRQPGVLEPCLALHSASGGAIAAAGMDESGVPGAAWPVLSGRGSQPAGSLVAAFVAEQKRADHSGQLLRFVHSRSQGRVRADAPSPARAEARTFAGSR